VTNITAEIQTSLQTLPNNDCMDFHEYDEINFDYQDDNSLSEFDNEDKSEDESNDEEERDGEEGDEEEDDDDDDEGDQDPIIDAPMNRD
jgi:hypothetical protein